MEPEALMALPAELELRLPLLPELVLRVELLWLEPPPELKVCPRLELKLWLPLEELRLPLEPEVCEEELWDE